MITTVDFISWDDLRETAGESFVDIFAEVGQFQEHLPFDPDLDIYKILADAGNIKILAARREDELVGWTLFWISPHQYHPSTKFAISDVTYVIPEHRGTGVLKEMLVKADALLRSIGVEAISWQARADKDFGAALEKQGYEKTTITYAKYIGD